MVHSGEFKEDSHPLLFSAGVKSVPVSLTTHPPKCGGKSDLCDPYIEFVIGVLLMGMGPAVMKVLTCQSLFARELSILSFPKRL